MYMLTKCKDCGNTEVFEEASNNKLFQKYRNECALEYSANTTFHILPQGHCVECAVDDHLEALAEKVLCGS